MAESGSSRSRWRDVAAASLDGVGILDGETVAYANDEFAACFGYDDPDAVVGEPWRRLYPHDERDRLEREALHADGGDGSWRGRATGLRADGRTVAHELSVRPAGDGDRVWIVRDASDGLARERELERYETLIETVTDGVYALDEELRFTFVNSALCEMVGLSPDALLDTDAREFFADEDDAEMAAGIRERVVADDTGTGTIEATLPTPDGDRILEARYRLHPEPDVEYRGSVGVIRDVTEREERERALERQRDELATLDRISELLLAVIRELVGTVDRDAVERTVCERLAASDLYRFAWTGDRDVGTDRIVARNAAGDADGYLGAVGSTDDASVDARGPAERAVRTGEVQVANVVSMDTPWREDALDRGFRSVVAVPLRHRETVYGVLVVYAPRPDAFSEREQEGFAALGETIGFAIAAIKHRRLLFADAVTELEFRFADADAFLTRVSGAFDCSLSLDGYVGSGDRWILYLGVDAAAAEQVVAEAADEPTVARARVVDDDGERARLELVVTESSLLHRATPAGGQVRSATVEGGVGTVHLEVPATADVHDVVDRFDAAFSSAELRARRERDRSPTQVEALSGLLDDLTDRQRGALETAFQAGYFEWPRESTAEEVAGALDVAAPTFHAHLRKAERSVFTSLFE